MILCLESGPTSTLSGPVTQRRSQRADAACAQYYGS